MMEPDSFERDAMASVKACDEDLRASLEQYRTLLNSIDDGFCTFDMIFDDSGHPVDYRFVDYNPAFERHTGLKNAVGRRVREFLPDQDEHWFEMYGQVAVTGKPIRVTRYGEALKRWFEVKAFRIGAPHQRRVGAFFADVTAQKEAELALQESQAWLLAQKQAFQAAVNGASIEVSLGVLARTAVEQAGPGSRCGFFLADHARCELRHIVGMSEDYAQCVNGVPIGPEEPGCGLAVYSNKPVITADALTSVRWESYRWLAKQFGIRGVWSFPIETTEGKVVGTFALYFDAPREATPRDLKFAAVLGQAAGIIISRHQEAEDRAHANAALRESEDRYRALAANLPSGAAFVVDRDLRYRLAAGKALDTLNSCSAEFEGKTIWEALSPALAAEYEPNYRAALAGQAFRCEHDSHGRHFVTHGVPLRDATGNVDAVLAVSYDITERRRVEAELRESEARFRNMADHAPVMVWMTESDGTCTYLSKSWYQFTGQTPERGLGFGWLDAVHPEDAVESARVFREANDQIKPFRLEYRLRRWDGEFRWAIDAAQPRFSEEGEFLGYIGSVIDITERKAAEETLRDADRRKDEFLATLAHELRNPLAPIRNSLHILRLAGSDSGVAERVHEMMERQVDQMVRLVDDLMEVSRISRGKIELRRERVELAGIIRNAVETSMPLMDAARHRLAISIPPEPITLDADPIRVAQVIANLLNNAAKYTDDGGQIWLTATRERSFVVVSVRDTGIGIPVEMLPKVFDLFIQIDRDSRRAQGGLGIGLTLVRNLVAMHGGSVEVRSAGRNQGSEFIVRLPLTTDVPPTPSHRSSKHPGLVSRRILVVDDNRDAADSLGMLLKALGADVYTVHDGTAALSALHEYQPVVILLDIGMPEMDGFEVAKRVRQRSEGKDVVLIALTGWGQEDDRRRTREAGFDHHLVKPVDLSALQAVLAAVPQCTPAS